MTEWRWLDRRTLEAVHDRQLAEHGGGTGLRDENGLESAIARPINRALYDESNAAQLAAAYAFGLARNHPFVDGNKRTAWVAARLFLSLNAVPISFDRGEATEMMQKLAAGDLTESEVADWFSARIS